MIPTYALVEPIKNTVDKHDVMPSATPTEEELCRALR
jgi:hypothetical protein